MCKLEYKWLLKGFGFLAGILCVLSCQNSFDSRLQSEVDKVASKFVPDNRTGICDIKIKTTGKTIVIKGETTNGAAKKAIIKTLGGQGKTVIDSILILPDTASSKNYMGLVTLSVINLRKEPDHAAELVSQARLGTPVVVLKEQNSWLLIQTPDNYISWTEKSSIVSMDTHEMAFWKKSQKVIYLENTGWLYDTTIVSSGVTGDLVAGCILEKTSEINGYIKVSLPDGRKGFVEKQKVMDFDVWKNNIKCTGDNVCKVARTFMGLPYLWGGTSTKGVDCSGFVQTVYFLNGLILQRDASLQALHGTDVDFSAGYSILKPGDLLFFGSKENGKNHVTHVAIYLGDNDYINSSGRVQINSLDSTKTNYVGFRISSLLSSKRIIGIEGDPGIVPVNKNPWY
jgi:gamma-D-glutamyl-L-lysine dipeptidyl-peptidase